MVLPNLDSALRMQKCIQLEYDIACYYMAYVAYISGIRGFTNTPQNFDEFSHDHQVLQNAWGKLHRN